MFLSRFERDQNVGEDDGGEWNSNASGGIFVDSFGGSQIIVPPESEMLESDNNTPPDTGNFLLSQEGSSQFIEQQIRGSAAGLASRLNQFKVAKMEASGCRRQGATARRSSPRFAKASFNVDQEVLASSISNLKLSGPQKDDTAKPVEHSSLTTSELAKRIIQGDDIVDSSHVEIK